MGPYVIVGIIALSLIPGFVYADSYVKMPILVNMYGFEQPDPQNDEERQAEIDNLKWRLKKGLIDANGILAKCHNDFDLPIMRLGDPENEEPQNIAFVIIPPESAETGGDTPEEREQTLREMARQGKSELNQRFGENKGQKIYVVSDEFNLGESVARGWDQGQIIWINNDGITVAPGTDGIVGISGPYFVHELLHNTGLQESDHGPPDNVFHSPTDLNKDRGITREQCDRLVEYFQNHGTEQTNSAQRGSFIPPSQKTYYALLVPGIEQTQHVSAIDHVEIYLDENNWMTANFVWSDFFTQLEKSEISILIGLDLDDNTDTTVSDYLDGADIQLQIDIMENEGVFYASGSHLTTEKGEIVKRPIDYVFLNAASEGNEIVSSDSIRIRHEIEFKNFGPQIPVSIAILDLTSDQSNSYSLEMDKIPEPPKLIGLPTVSPANTEISISGKNFEPNQAVSIFLNHARITHAETDDKGSFSANLETSDLPSGDYFVEAVGSKKFAFGILTVGLPQEEYVIPAWIKNNAGWWADGIITDSDFVQGIQYLIKEGIMKVPDTQASSGASTEIPSWVKSNAGWWADGIITDEDFIAGIQYLIENGIIRL